MAERWPGTGLNSEEEAAEAVFSFFGAWLQNQEMFIRKGVLFFLVSAFSYAMMKEE
ncbi:hypothetical protein [Proteiniclasticum sp.]|uniref:hypothetical protein n=1 Tax=Proteiniclasticum sp. TaxID=2053595 RepID=UPI0025E17866|nr:hypothetical protein [Proteiniclasticum sp.]